MTNTHSVDSLRVLNAKLLAEIKKLAKFESEKAKLKRHDVENPELKSRVGDLEARLAIV
jgi:hypothetical protein